MDISCPRSQEEKIIVVIPTDFIHFKLEGLFMSRFLCLHVNEGNQVFLVSNGDRLAIRRPTDINVLSFGWDVGDTSVGTDIPKPNRFVQTGCHK